MSFVVPYRNIDEYLKQLAKEENLSVGRFISHVIERYIDIKERRHKIDDLAGYQAIPLTEKSKTWLINEAEKRKITPEKLVRKILDEYAHDKRKAS